MATRSLPVVVEGRAVGKKAGGEYTDKSTGEVRTFGPKLQLLWETPDGEADLVDVRMDAADEVADFDVAGVSPGQGLKVEGVARAGNNGIYLVPLRITQLTGKAA